IAFPGGRPPEGARLAEILKEILPGPEAGGGRQGLERRLGEALKGGDELDQAILKDVAAGIGRRIVAGAGPDSGHDGAQGGPGGPHRLDGRGKGRPGRIVAAGREEESSAERAVAAAAGLAGEMLPQAVGGAGWNDDDRRARLIGQGESDETAPRLR